MPPNFPNEVLSKIFSHLLTDNEKHCLDSQHLGDITKVRLVCRLWNELASKHLFRTIALHSDVDTMESWFCHWHHLINSKDVANAARRVAIESGTEYWQGSCYKGSWPASWEESGKWPAFVSAIERIYDMPNLDAIEVRFTSCCAGRDTYRQPWGDVEVANPEPIATRLYTLSAVAEAIEKRATRPEMTVIRELVLDNLQNMPLPNTIANSLFRNIQRLHIKILSENNGKMHPDEERPDLIHCEELRLFPRYLQYELLPSIAHQLVELTISGKHWGGIPGEFNGKHLWFPKLKTLTLDGWDFVRRDQFNFILQQGTISALHLHNCTIATHCHVQQPDFDRWNVELKGWSKVDTLSPVMGLDLERPLAAGWYENSLRWSTIFDTFSGNFPLLEHFSFDRRPWAVHFRHDDTSLFPEQMELRYLAFSGRWFEPPRLHYHERSELQKSMPRSAVEKLAKSEKQDRQALEKFLQTIEDRRNKKFDPVVCRVQ
ncbi:hypothetical protein NXS19_008459 [Fusarium pseudograminearum]|nr:hypothetical protein NXS19_008459 [Fusarium pseudograminearum]